jgi:UDP-GlcNAc:undecaprenyl-phosphate/decaprenyl-phosphate GlcNAc-1-phosphate transferase
VFTTLAILTFALAAGLSFILCPFFIRLAHAKNLLDYPHDRKQHKGPTPYLGGCVLFISFWTVFIPAFVLLEHFHSLDSFTNNLIASRVPQILIVFAGSLVIFILGLLDDKFDMPPFVKLAGQSVVAAVSMYFGLVVNTVAPFGVFGYVITFGWILIIINAFNFIDSIDGHCAGITVISCFVFFAIALIIYQPVLALVVAALSGALLGFLPFNYKPAKIFLGDNGSLFLGYMMAALTLLYSYRTPQYSVVTPFIPVFMFGVPIYDTVSVIIVRLFRGIPPWKGDRNHFAHRLVRLGMSDQIAAQVSFFIAFTMGLVAVLSTQINTFLGKIILAALFISIVGIIALLEYYAAMRIRLVEKLGALQKRRKEDIREAEEQA